MVAPANRRSAQPADEPLLSWLGERCQYWQRQRAIDFVLEFPPDLAGVRCSWALLQATESALREAVHVAPAGTPVELAAYRTRRGLEIEIAVMGDADGEDLLQAFRRESSQVGNGFTLSTYRARCPQGGLAWIIVQSGFVPVRLVA